MLASPSSPPAHNFPSFPLCRLFQPPSPPKVAAAHFAAKKPKIGFCAWWTNKQEPTSDLTIVVTLRKPMGWRFYALKDFLEYKLNCQIDLTTVEGIKPMVREEVLSMTKFV